MADKAFQDEVDAASESHPVLNGSFADILLSRRLNPEIPRRVRAISKFELENKTFHWLTFTGVRQPDGSLALQPDESVVECLDATRPDMWHSTSGAYLFPQEKLIIPPLGKREIVTTLYDKMRPSARRDHCRFVVRPEGDTPIVSPIFEITAATWTIPFKQRNRFEPAASE